MTDDTDYKETRTLEKTDEGLFKLTIDKPEVREHFVKLHTRADLRDTYKNMLLPNKAAIENQLGQRRAQLKKLDVEDSDELRDLMDKLKKINDLQQKKQLEDQIEKMEKDLEITKQHMKEIEHAMPEVTRKKK